MVTKKKSGIRLFVALACLGLATCGIFTPRDSETPIAVAATDPLHFSAIMSGTGKYLTRLQYDFLFLPDFMYTDNNSQSYSQKELVQRLKQIQLAGDSVLWKPGTILDRGDTAITLSGLTYYIYYGQSEKKVPDDSGNADFVVTKNNRLEWYISSWRDIPLRPGKSFFAL